MRKLDIAPEIRAEMRARILEVRLGQMKSYADRHLEPRPDTVAGEKTLPLRVRMAIVAADVLLNELIDEQKSVLNLESSGERNVRLENLRLSAMSEFTADTLAMAKLVEGHARLLRGQRIKKAFAEYIAKRVTHGIPGIAGGAKLTVYRDWSVGVEQPLNLSPASRKERRIWAALSQPGALR